MIADAYYTPPQGRHFNYPNCYNWRPVFAWLPKVTIGGRRIWFQLVYKRRYYTALGPPIGQSFHMEPVVEYGDVFDMLKDNHE